MSTKPQRAGGAGQTIALPVLFVFTFTALINITFLFALSVAGMWTNEATDYAAYFEPVAKNLAAGRGLVRPDGLPATEHPPGYAILLAAVFRLAAVFGLNDDLAYAAVAIVSMGLAAILLFLISANVWGRRGGYCSAFMFATYPFALWLTKEPNTETPFLPVFYGAVYLCWLGLNARDGALKYFFFAGCLIGTSMLFRPFAIGAGVFLAFSVLLLKQDATFVRRCVLTGVLLIGSVLPVAVWETWVFSRTSTLVPLSRGGAPSIRDGLTYAVNPSNAVKIAVPKAVEEVQSNIAGQRSQLTSVRAVGRALWIQFEETPAAVAQMLLIKMARGWYGTDSGRLESFILAVQAFYIPLILAASAACWSSGERVRRLTALLGILTIYFWGMTTMVLSIVRYMVPAIGLLFALVPSLNKNLRGPDQKNAILADN